MGKSWLLGGVKGMERGKEGYDRGRRITRVTCEYEVLPTSIFDKKPIMLRSDPTISPLGSLKAQDRSGLIDLVAD